jgi:hypothetical protein
MSALEEAGIEFLDPRMAGSEVTGEETWAALPMKGRAIK